jgi:myoferlin
VLDKGFFKEAMIGCYEFDIAWVYFQPKHALLHKWIALSNPESGNYEEVAGYLKLSLNVSTVGDEQLQITEDNGADNSEESVLMPPSIRPEFYQIRFKFFKAEHLPAMDRNLLGRGSIDAYVLC